MKTPLRFAALAGLPLLTCLTFAADTADSAIELSPFVVEAGNDTGYQATSTLSGTRFRTSLQDTAASVSVFTDAFIEDLQIQSVEELANFTVSQVIDLDDTIIGWDQRTQSQATLTVQPIRIRGIQSSQAVDYFKRIYPSDGYNIARYDESRGPNGILFGVSNAGGLINTSSVLADVRKNSGRVRLTFESTGGARQEFRYNHALIRDRLGLVVAGVNQEDEGWQHHVWDDAERLYGALTWKVNDRLSFRVNAETGRRNHSTEQTSPPLAFGAMVYTDWVDFLGGNSQLLFPAANANATAAQRARGLGNRNTNANGANQRWAFVVNDGAFYNAAGEYTYQEYGSGGVHGPDWTAPSDLTGTQRLRLNRPDLFPYTINATGPGQYKDEDFCSHSLFADLRVTDDLYLNLAYNRQTIDVDAPNTANFNWQITVDPNTTRGVPTLANGTPNPGYGGENPYAGYYMFESDWRRDTNHSETEEARLSAAYTLDFAKRGRGFLGSHQIAAMAATSTFEYQRVNQSLGFLGGPWSANFDAADNRVQLRSYFPLEQAKNDPASIHVPDWRKLPSSVVYDGTSYDLGWYNQPASGQNAAYKQDYETWLGVIQSHFWDRRIVTTFGYRRDNVSMDQYGHSSDPLRGDVIDRNIIDSSNDFSGETRTAGIVFHVNKYLDLVANRSSNIGVPDARHTVLPDGKVPDPSRGRGEDFGIGFRLFDNRLHGRLVYYTTDERALVENGGNFNAFNNIITGLGNALIAAGHYTETTWSQRRAELGLDREWSGVAFNLESEGYELNLTANLTPNWRLSLNASKTDRIQTDRNADVAAFYGWTPDANSPEEFGFFAIGIEQDASGIFRIVDPSAYSQGGGYANLIMLGNELGSGGLETLSVVANGRTATDFMLTIQQGINDNRLRNQRRMGLRPYKFNVFTAYDFTRGFLKGLTIGGGFAWQDRAVIGLMPDLTEVYNDPLLKTNLMMRYRFRRDTGWLKGRWALQVNVDNVLDDDDAILQRYQNVQNFVKVYQLPGAWGPAVQRWDLVEGINARASITYEF